MAVDKRDDLSRPYVLDVFRSGHVTIRAPGDRLDPGALPVFSTETEEQARAILVHFCRLSRDNSKTYRLNQTTGKDVLGLEDLDAITVGFRMHYAKQLQAAAAAPAPGGPGSPEAIRTALERAVPAMEVLASKLAMGAKISDRRQADLRAVIEAARTALGGDWKLPGPRTTPPTSRS